MCNNRLLHTGSRSTILTLPFYGALIPIFFHDCLYVGLRVLHFSVNRYAQAAYYSTVEVILEILGRKMSTCSMLEFGCSIDSAGARDSNPRANVKLLLRFI